MLHLVGETTNKQEEEEEKRRKKKSHQNKERAPSISTSFFISLHFQGTQTEKGSTTHPAAAAIATDTVLLLGFLSDIKA